MKTTHYTSITLYSSFLLLACLNGFAQSQILVDSSDCYVLNTDYPIQSLAAKTKILLDEKGTLSIEGILQAKQDQKFSDLREEMYTVTGPAILWLKLSICPEINIQDWWLVFKRDTSHRAYTTSLRYVDVYFTQEGQISKHSKAGLFIPASQKEIAEYNTTDRVMASFSKGVPIDIYLRVQDNSELFNILELRNPILGLPSPIARQDWGTIMLSNFSLILCIYVFCFFFYTRDKSFLLLFGMFSFLFLHYQLLLPNLPLIDWFFPEHPHWVEAAWLILTMGTHLFFLQFGRVFTRLKELAPFWDKMMLWTIRLIFTLAVLRLSIWLFHLDFANNLQWLFGGIPFLLALTLVVRLVFIKDILVRHFVFGAIWLFFFSLLGLAWENGIIPFFDLPNPWMVAQGGFMLIYALALARKIQISERAKSEVEKVKAIDTIKSKFFANISHEFRTPLSLILGPINQSLESIPASEIIEADSEVPVKGKHLSIMKRNALRLQNLVDQILDLSKLDQGKMQLQVAEGNLIAFIRAIVFSFESMAERKHIHFHTHFPPVITSAYFDRDKLEKILVNLLSNAFKFTPEHGKVSVWLEDTDNGLKILITDTGGGIRAEEAAKIFERFYQVEGTRDQGTGIGLSLVKELVQLHRGQVGVDSTEGQGTTFKVTLPYRKADFVPAEISTIPSETALSFIQNNSYPIELNEEKETNTHKDQSELPILLIVEDNPDLRQYISEQMSTDFQILMAADGEKGITLAETRLPDLVISDVMMPKKNGLELCQALKSNIKTSHIPIILLTAKAGDEAKIEGLETGADDYLTKPFNGRELLTRARNLIEQRVLLREKFSGELKISPTAVTLNSIDENFIKQVMSEIEQNMGNEFYSVENLATAVGFSRSQLHRKLKGLTGQSPNQLIRAFRLERAKELLEQKSASVSEIAYQVGYSNLSYFSKSYKEAFGFLPRET